MKVIKLRKLVMGVMVHDSNMQRHKKRVGDGGYTMVPLYVANNGYEMWWTMEELGARRKER